MGTVPPRRHGPHDSTPKNILAHLLAPVEAHGQEDDHCQAFPLRAASSALGVVVGIGPQGRERP